MSSTNQSGNTVTNEVKPRFEPAAPAVTPVTPSSKMEALDTPGLLSLSGWLILASAFLLVVMVTMLGVALNNNGLLWVGLVLSVAFLSVTGTLYVTGRNITARTDEQREVLLSGLTTFEEGHLALTSGLEGMSEGLLLAQLDGELIYTNKRTEELLKWCGAYQPGQTIKTLDEWLGKIRPFITHRDSFKYSLLSARQFSGQGQVPSFEFSIEKPIEALKSTIQQPIRPTPFIHTSGELGRDPGGDLANRPVRDLRMTLFPIDDAAGRQIGTGYLLRDVTRDRELDRLKDQFVSMVSHELRNPISIILSMTEILGDDGLGAEERHRWISQINNEAMRLRAMLNDMLDISRLEEGKLELSLLPVSLKPMISSIVDNFRLQQNTPHEITVDLQMPDPRVMADAGKLSQVLTNLVGNALKYSPKGGVVTVTVREASAPETEEGMPEPKRMLEVSVTDQGMGIPEKEQAKIFGRFYRSSTSKRSGISGTGLGLSITQRLVKMMGGNIWFSSKEGEGSTFFFTLPAAK